MVNRGLQFFMPKGSYKQRILRSILLLIVSLVIIFGVYTYYDYKEGCREDALKESKNISERIVSSVDEKLTSLKQYYAVISEDEAITWILENNLDYSNYSKYKAANDCLAGKNIFGDYVQNYTFVNYRTSWVLSSKGMYKTEESKNYDLLKKIFETKANNFEKNYWYYDPGNIIYSKMSRDYRVTEETNGLNIIIKLPASSYETYALVVANINLNTWQKWIDELLDENENIVVVSDDNTVIYSTNPDFNSDILSMSVNDDKSGFINKDKHRSYAVGANTSGILGWKYYCIYDVEAGFPSMRFPGMLMILILAIISAVYLLIVQIIYMPIGKLMKGVSRAEDYSNSNEIDYLAEVLSSQKNKLKELFELRLLHGEVKEDEWDDYIKSLGLDNFKYFATSVVIIQVSDEEIQSMVDEDVLCLKLLQNLPEDIKNLTWMPPIYNASAIFTIFAGDDEEELLEKIKSYYSVTQEATKKLGEYKMQMGVSATHTSFKHIRAAYRESINALTLMHLGNTKKDNINEELEECHFYLSSSTSRNNTYTNKYEEDIKAAIKAVDKDLCYQITDDFYSFLVNHQGLEEELEIYILRYANTILVTAIEVGVNMAGIYPDGVRKLYRELLQVAEPARVRRYIKAHFIDPVIEARSEYLKTYSTTILDQIEKNIMDRHGDISLAECADELGVNQTYIWKVLKMEKGKSFSDYQEEYKLEEAKRLLRETNLTVAEIAEKLNYTNAQNFIRFFNKTTGVTPGKFRKLY